MAEENIAADRGAAAIAHNTELAGWVLEWRSHGLEMLLADLIAYAEREGFNMTAKMRAAQQIADDCR